jgi:hypothetical protein
VSRYPRLEQLDLDLPRLSRYVTSGHADVHGWLYPPDAELISAVGLFQASAGVIGSVGEIGVHEGRLFILLMLLSRRDTETAFCIDVFDRQALNIDPLVRGNERAFFHNVRRHVGETQRISVFRSRSEDVTASQILDAAGEPRMLSVDGGHSAATAAHDVRLSAEVLGSRGVMLLDDFFNPAWPEVSDGVRAALAEGDVDLTPFAIGANKVLFARDDHAIEYRNQLRDAVPRRFLKAAELMGRPVAVFAIQDSRAVVHLRRAVRKLRGAARAGLHRG